MENRKNIKTNLCVSRLKNLVAGNETVSEKQELQE